MAATRKKKQRNWSCAWRRSQVWLWVNFRRTTRALTSPWWRLYTKNWHAPGAWSRQSYVFYCPHNNSWTVESTQNLFWKAKRNMFQFCRGRILLASASVFDLHSVALIHSLFTICKYCRVHGFKSQSGLNVFSGFNLQLLKLCMSSCLSPQFNSYIQIFICILHHLRAYYELTMWPAPSWFDSSVGKALNRYCRGHICRFRSQYQLCLHALANALAKWTDHSLTCSSEWHCSIWKCIVFLLSLLY